MAHARPVWIAAMLLLCAVAHAATPENPGTPDSSVQAASARFRAPRSTGDPLFYLPPGHELVKGSLQVTYRGTAITAASDSKPNPGEYALLGELAVRFSPEDRRKEMTITYQYRQRRVAVVQTLNRSDLDYIAAAVQDSAVDALEKLGFAVVSGADVSLALREHQISPEALVSGSQQQPIPGTITALAHTLDVDSIVASAASAGQMSESEGFVIVPSYGGGGFVLPTESTHASLSVLIVMYDGGSGKSTMSKVKSGTRNTELSGNRKARKAMAASFAIEVLKEHFGVQ